jgi:hypothetical protein
MPADEVDFRLLVRPEVPTRNSAKGDPIFQEGDAATSSSSLCAAKSRSGAATVCSKP